MVYPRRCPVCHDIAVPRGRAICRECLDKLVPIHGPRCFKCSKPLSDREAEFCYDCASKKHSYDRGISIFPYGSVLSQSLYQLKYHQRQEYGRFYGRYAAACAGEQIRLWGPEVLIPVPLHPKRMEKRGYNQAEIIAGEIGRILQLPVDTKTVVRRVNTKPQKELNDKERRSNLRSAFAVRQPKLPWKKILIIDDIYTTGSTVDGVSLALKAAGAEQVYFLTIAIGTGFC
ncbi:ComF family protein [Blautia marasmi]|uniref:ComF family protein n=1 Tax=Blautia marasmi TaxID=1917868 RepID=UPI0025985395|nr:ComF family protein [uncultured Blautia sp.]